MLVVEVITLPDLLYPIVKLVKKRGKLWYNVGTVQPQLL